MVCAHAGRGRRAGSVRARRASRRRQAGVTRAHGGRASLAPAGRRGHPLPARQPVRPSRKDDRFLLIDPYQRSIVIVLRSKRLKMVHLQSRKRCFVARPEARPLGAASPLINPNTQHMCPSVGIYQRLSESIAHWHCAQAGAEQQRYALGPTLARLIYQTQS